MESTHGHHPGSLAETLETLGRVQHYNRWIYEQFRNTLGMYVLEIGAGIGNITRILAEESGREIWATDVEEDFLGYLKKQFHDTPAVHVRSHNALEVFITESGTPVDSILCINVLEHISDDEAALEAMFRSLAPGGYLNLLVPAGPWLYGTIDRAIGHYRRYKRGELKGKLERAGFRVERLYAFNPIGIFGWWLQGKILHRRTLSPKQTRLFDRMVPFIRWLPFQRNPWLGLSLIAIARKPSTTAPANDSG